MKNKKIIIITSVVLGILILTIGVSYSLFLFSKTGNNSKLIVGDIYMHYVNSDNSINLENAMPTNPYIVNSIMVTQEYTEDGTNELSKCVNYFNGVNFDTGSSAITYCQGTGTYNKNTFQQNVNNYFNSSFISNLIQENILTFDYEIPYFEFTIDGKNTTTNKDIWYEIILKYGDDIENKTRIKNDLLKFTLTETKDGVTKTVFNGRSYVDLNNKRIWVNTINKNTINDVSITYRLYMYISNDIIIGNVDQDYTIDEWNNIFASIKVDVMGDFNEKTLAIAVDDTCFTTYTIDNYQLNTNMTTDELNECITYFTGWNFNYSETPEAFCQGTGTRYGETFQEYLYNDRFSSDTLIYLETNNIINLSSKSIEITDYDNTCGSDIIIPSKINEYNVTKIADGSFYGKNLNSVIIPNSITYISDYAFYKNQLTNIIIPNSVTYIGYGAFKYNNITSVTIPESVTHLDCDAFDNIVTITKSTNLTCYQKPHF